MTDLLFVGSSVIDFNTQITVFILLNWRPKLIDSMYILSRPDLVFSRQPRKAEHFYRKDIGYLEWPVHAREALY